MVSFTVMWGMLFYFVWWGNFTRNFFFLVKYDTHYKFFHVFNNFPGESLKLEQQNQITAKYNIYLNVLVEFLWNLWCVTDGRIFLEFANYVGFLCPVWRRLSLFVILRISRDSRTINFEGLSFGCWEIWSGCRLYEISRSNVGNEINFKSILNDKNWISPPDATPSLNMDEIRLRKFPPYFYTTLKISYHQSQTKNEKI